MSKQSPTLPSQDRFVQLHEISRCFNRAAGTRVLDTVSLDISPGEWLSITGPSGAGKSTLLNIIGCLDQPDSGTYMFDEMQVLNLNDRERSWFRSQYIGFVFQTFHLLPHRPVLENVMLGELYRSISRQGRETRARAALEKVGLLHKIDDFPKTLSGGEKQRVAIARAVMGNPKILLCDEPTGNLDSHSTLGILKLFAELNARGLTLVVVTHDNQVAARGHRQVHMIDGRLRQEFHHRAGT